MKDTEVNTNKYTGLYEIFLLELQPVCPWVH